MCLRCAAFRLLEFLPGRKDCKILKSETTHLALNLSHISSEAEDSGGLGIFAVHIEITSLASIQTRLGRRVKERNATEEVE